MSLHVLITRFDDVLCDPDATPLWQETHRNVGALQALELVDRSCRGILATETMFAVTQISTGRFLTRDQLARVAYTRACSPAAPADYRERFVAWFCDALGDILFPWDDGAPYADPPLPYWEQAACWALRIVGPTVPGWLALDIAPYPGGSDFASLVARHATQAATPRPACAHCRLDPPGAVTTRA
ncbi:hypothetical protein SAMN04487905_1208 [Actinopolyspora xinjiangensis]|uniref:Uncharacterized protein n=1 Tax=Actinopolyspora xinjiangensis TaxID=405564 RepID=A0A1H0X1I8_9ACTN|nr:hypothetical protein [Actinopolyspora xinjiangensis]SDP96326.1 hypothetical protein SAMN04487905_1208 [Actinopolyspora xinjiangensis]